MVREILPSSTLGNVQLGYRGLAAIAAAVALIGVGAAFGVASEGHQPASRARVVVPPEPAAVAVAAPAEAPAPAPAAPPAEPVVAQPVEAAPAPTLPPAPWKLMLIGDSMAFTAGLGLAPHAPAYEFTLANEGINGCGVVRGGPYRYFGVVREMEARCEAWPAAWSDALARNQPLMVGIVVGRWELMDRVHNGQWTNLFDPAFAAYVESEIDAAVALAGSGGARVVVFTSPYYRRGIPPGGGLFPEDDPARVDIVNSILRRVAERHGAHVVDVGGWLSPDGQYTATVGGVKVRSDGVHLTRQTGAVLAPWLFPQLQAAMRG